MKHSLYVMLWAILSLNLHRVSQDDEVHIMNIHCTLASFGNGFICLQDTDPVPQACLGCAAL